MRGFALALGPVVASLFLLHCGGKDSPTNPVTPTAQDSGTPAPNPSVTNNDDAGPGSTADPPLVPASKVDLLFVVDNSASMGDKQDALTASIDHLFKGLGATDIHVGVISSSLGEGGDVCAVDAAHPHSDDKAHLLNQDSNRAVVAGAENGFLSFGAGGITDLTELEQKTSAIVRGVSEAGCGLEVQLEAMYRFVSMPDPPASITKNQAQQAVYADVDYALLAQRKAFFRPDSAVGIILISDEDDGSIDARAIGGLGYAFASKNFPGSQVRRGTVAQGTTAPRGTSECTTQPLSADCTSCGFAAQCDQTQASCQKLRADVNCSQSNVTGQSGAGYDGFFGPSDDDLNVRDANMKERFGVDPRFPIGRYVAGLIGRRVPDSKAEHPTTGGTTGTLTIGDYVQAANCQNALFAANLPEKAGDELCNLGDNQRSSKLVFFGFIGGVPKQLLDGGPQWTKIVGTNPAAYDFSGIDPHMVPSIDPRPELTAGGSSSLPRGQNGTDPINGREWSTNKKDLQYACTFPLATPRDCIANPDSCDCGNDPNGGQSPNPPLCATDGSATQIRGKAYPTTRELILAQALGDRAVVGSLCDVDTSFGYGTFLDAFAAKLTTGLKK